MKIPKDMKAGRIHQTNDGPLAIVKYTNYKNVDVIFINTLHKKTCIAGDIRLGHVKDPMAPKVFGVGYIGVGPHKPTAKRKQTKAYARWRGMLARCYYEKSREKQPTYIGCYVCDEWLNFQNFAEWFYENYVHGLHIDKDILVDGNKVYSPETCIFVTQSENNEKAWAKTYRFKSPSGEVVEVYNLAKFCRENNLRNSHMYRVHIGERNHHKGWRAAN